MAHWLLPSNGIRCNPKKGMSQSCRQLGIRTKTKIKLQNNKGTQWSITTSDKNKRAEYIKNALKLYATSWLMLQEICLHVHLPDVNYSTWCMYIGECRELNSTLSNKWPILLLCRQGSSKTKWLPCKPKTPSALGLIIVFCRKREKNFLSAKFSPDHAWVASREDCSAIQIICTSSALLQSHWDRPTLQIEQETDFALTFVWTGSETAAAANPLSLFSEGSTLIIWSWFFLTHTMNKFYLCLCTL